MRCHSSIWRWSPRLGICLSKSTGPSGWITKGAIVWSSAAGFASISLCQCASGPSPRQGRMPMPVIQASRLPSAMARNFEWVGKLTRPGFDVRAELRVWERHRAEADLGFAHRFAVAGEPRFGDGEAGALVHQAGLARESFARIDEAAQRDAIRSEENRS